MQYLGNKARVFVGGKWSPFMAVPEAEKLAHNHKVTCFLAILRQGKQVIGLSDDIPALSEAGDLYRKERESVVTTLTQNAE